MKTNEILNEIDKRVKTGLTLGVFKDRLGRKLLELHRFDLLDEWSVGQINKRVERQLRKDAFREIPFRQPQLNSGDMILGADDGKRPVKSHIQYMNAGSLLVGNTGCGKTTLICFYVLQIARHVKGMWLVDLRKKEFRALKALLARIGIELVIIRSRQFKINPLQVPAGVDPQEYASTIADVLVRVLNLPPRACVLLGSSIVKLYKEFNIINGGTKYPTLFHLFENVRANRDANAQSRQAVLDNLERLLLALGPETLGYYRGWPVDELAKKHIVFELTGLPEAGKDLILNYLVAAEFISRISKGVSNRKMDLFLNFDEGQITFSQSKETGGGNSITDLAGLVRGTGIGLFVSILTPEDLSNKISSITSTRIMGRCGSIPEYKAAGRFLGLNEEQVYWCAHHLVPGTFVGQVSEGNWRYPFLFKVPKMSRLQPVSDAEADESLKMLDHLKVEPVEFSDWSATERVEVKTTQSSATVTLTDTEIKLLKAIIENPLLPSSRYVKLAKISPNTLSKLRPRLIERGLIREHELDTSGRGRGKKVLEPLKDATEVLKSGGVI